MYQITPNNSYFCFMGKKRTEKIVFENVKILDAGAKGVSVAKAPDGKVIFLPNVVPGDVVCLLYTSDAADE